MVWIGREHFHKLSMPVFFVFRFGFDWELSWLIT